MYLHPKPWALLVLICVIQVSERCVYHSRACDNIRRGLELLSWVSKQPYAPDNLEGEVFALYSRGIGYHAKAEYSK